MAMAFEIVKRNMMRPNENGNTEMWGGNGIISPIACDNLYFWLPMNKQDRTRLSSVNSANVFSISTDPLLHQNYIECRHDGNPEDYKPQRVDK